MREAGDGSGTSKGFWFLEKRKPYTDWDDGTPDFEKKSAYKKSYEGRLRSYDFGDGSQRYDMSGVPDWMYEYINRDPDVLTAVSTEEMTTGRTSAGMSSTYLLQMTKDEVARYNYIHATKGKDEANRYVSQLADELRRREGQANANAYLEADVPDPVKGGMIALEGFNTGWNNAVRGVAQNVAPQASGPTSGQYEAQAIREGLENTGPKVFGNSLGQIGYDLATSAGNMAPSAIVGGAFGGAAGAASAGLSARGHAYDRALKEGYTKEQASSYATLVGASEGALQYVLGGISKLGGKITNNIIAKSVENLQSAAGKAMAKLGISALGEATEEVLQNKLEPLFRNLVFGEKNEIKPLTEEDAYSALMAVLTVGVMEGPGVAADGARKGIDAVKSASEQMLTKENMNRFWKDVDGVFTGAKPSGEDIIIGETPSILQKYGAPDLDLHVSQTATRKIVYPEGYLHGKHNLGMSAMKKLPYQIADPVAILRSNTQPDSFVIMTQWKDKNGLDVIVPIHMNKQGTIEPQNSVTSAYGKGGIDALLGQNDENILYTKKGEDIRQLLSKGLQLPEAMADDVLAKNSISPIGQKVNTLQNEAQRMSEQAKQITRQLKDADSKQKTPYAEMGRVLLDSGIVPTDEMLKAMGMTRDEARRHVILQQFKKKKP